jgi:hypothetical protein
MYEEMFDEGTDTAFACPEFVAAAAGQGGQVDLDLEENVRELEDPSLIAHMESARQSLARQMAELLMPPKRSELMVQMAYLHQNLADVLKYLEASRQGQDDFLRATSGFCKLMKTKQLMDTATEIDTSAKNLVAVLAQLQNKLLVIRREYEKFTDDTSKYCNNINEERLHLREYLAVVNQWEVTEKIKDPPQTLGERLLALGLQLPEDSGIDPCPNPE